MRRSINLNILIVPFLICVLVVSCLSLQSCFKSKEIEKQDIHTIRLQLAPAFIIKGEDIKNREKTFVITSIDRDKWEKDVDKEMNRGNRLIITVYDGSTKTFYAIFKYR